MATTSHSPIAFGPQSKDVVDGTPAATAASPVTPVESTPEDLAATSAALAADAERKRKARIEARSKKSVAPALVATSPEPDKPSEAPAPDSAPTSVVPDIATSPEPEQDEQLRKAKVEAERLSNLPSDECAFRLSKSAEMLGITEARLRAMIHAIRQERGKLVQAERLQQDLAKREAAKERDQQVKTEIGKQKQAERAQEQAAKRAEQDQVKAAKEAERKAKEAARQAEQERLKAEREAARKAQEKVSGFAIILRLSSAQHEGELAKLATRLGEDLAVLRGQMKEFAGVVEGSSTLVETAPWPEPVDLADVLNDLKTKIGRYVAIQPHQTTTATLWAAHTWTYDFDVPVHSPLLAATSAEENSGKTTLVTVTGHACPRFKLNVEMTGPSLFRFVDQHQPTLLLDEADDLFTRRSDLKHVVNSSWTRGSTVSRQVRVDGILRTVHFSIFGPKALALIGNKLPKETRSRCIELRMLPRRRDETIEEFNHQDDAEFAVIRRKLLRWATDSATSLKAATPEIPSSLINRAAANWKLMLAIADMAGGSWPVDARKAAEHLVGRRRASDGAKLLAVIRGMSVGKQLLTSEDIVTELRKDPTSIWADYNRGGPITQRQVAHLLDAFDIDPKPLHPTGRKDFARRGYEVAQFADAFARYLPDDPIICSPQGVEPEKPPSKKPSVKPGKQRKKR